MRLENKTILITGASSGLGRGVAEALGKRHNRLVLTARRLPLLEEVAGIVRAAGSECVVATADATDKDSVQAVLDAGIAAFGAIDVALLNAGGGDPAPMDSTSIERVTEIMRRNYDTFVNFLMPLIDHMKDREAMIAYTGSPAGYVGLPKSGPYSAAKAAGRILFDSARVDLAGRGISFVGLYPGFTYTPGLDPSQIPSKALVITLDRAVREMIWAMEEGKEHHMFPKRIAALMAFGRSLPEPLRRRVLDAAT